MHKLNHLQKYLAQEFVDDYHEGHMTRREMVARVLGITGGIASAATLLLTLGCQPAAPATPTAAVAVPPLQPTQAPTAAPTGVPSPTAAPSQPTAASPQPTTASQPTQPPAKPGATPGGTPAAAAGQPAARSRLAVPPDDPGITAADVTFPGADTTLAAYLAQPVAAGPNPAVMVCHENRGLTEHIRDVTRRLAKAGYVALAVDLLAREGGTSQVDPAQVPGKLSADLTRPVADFQAAFKYLQTLPSVQKENIGMTGFCYGGGITWLVATAIPDLKAAVPFYGANPPLADVPKIRAAVLAIYGGNDQRINAGIPAIEEAMKQNGKTYEKIVYEGANHAFHNDTGANWNEQAAYDAWQKTLDWFKKYLV